MKTASCLVYMLGAFCAAQGKTAELKDEFWRLGLLERH